MSISYTPGTAAISCPRLETVSLSDCWIGDEGGRAIAAVLPRSGSLQELQLGGNELSEETQATLKQSKPRSLWDLRLT